MGAGGMRDPGSPLPSTAWPHRVAAPVQRALTSRNVPTDPSVIFVHRPGAPGGAMKLTSSFTWGRLRHEPRMLGQHSRPAVTVTGWAITVAMVVLVCSGGQASAAPSPSLSRGTGRGSWSMLVTNGDSDNVLWMSPFGSIPAANLQAGLAPDAVTIDAPSAKAFVTNYRSGTVSVLDLASSTCQRAPRHQGEQCLAQPATRHGATRRAVVGAEPTASALDVVNKTLYVANSGSGTVTPISTTTGLPGPAIHVGGFPIALAASSSGSRLYVVDVESTTAAQLVVVDVTNNTPVKHITLGELPHSIAVSPNGRMAYVTETGEPVLDTLETTYESVYAPVSLAPPGGNVLPIDLTTGQIEPPIPVGTDPMGIALADNGTVAWVANDGSGTVQELNLSTRTPGLAIPVGSGPQQVAVSPSGHTAVVTVAGAGQVALISTSSHKLLATRHVPGEPLGLAILHEPVPIHSRSIRSSSFDPAVLGGHPSRSRERALSAPVAYVANSASGTVTPIDTVTHQAERPIKVGTGPAGIASSPDGSTVYVGNDKSNDVSVIDTRTNSVVATIATPAPSVLAVTPNGATVLVVNTGQDAITPIDAHTRTTGAPIAIFGGAGGVAIAPSGLLAVAVAANSNAVYLVDLATDTAWSAIAVGVQPQDAVVAPDSKMAYVANGVSDSITPVDLATGRTLPAIAVGQGPIVPAVVPDGRMLYVDDFGAGVQVPVSNTVSAVDLATGATSAITVGYGPSALAVTPNGATVYVCNAVNGSVSPISTASNRAGPAIPVGSLPLAIAVAP